MRWTRAVRFAAAVGAIALAVYAVDARRGRALAGAVSAVASTKAKAQTGADEEWTLHVMAACGQPSSLEALLRAGADVNAVDRHGYTALHYACVEGRLDCLKILFAHGAKRDIQNEDGYTAFDLALVMGNWRVLAAFTEGEKGLNTAGLGGLTPLLRAAMDGNVDVVGDLLKRGASVKALDKNGNTALHHAAWCSEPGAATLLLEANIAVDVRNAAGFTALHCAAARGRMETVKALLAAGADASVGSLVGTTALHIAAQRGDVDMARAVLAKGANADSMRLAGDTPLHTAVRLGDVEMVDLLLQNGASVFAADSRAWGSMVSAMAECPPAVLAVLPPPDVKTLAKHRDGPALLLTALQKGAPGLAEALLAEGTALEGTDREGNTPLHLAAFRGSAALCEMILLRGGDVEARNAAGDTPLICAIRSNDKARVKVFVDRGARLFCGDSVSWLRALDAVSNCSGDVVGLIPRWSTSSLARSVDDKGSTLLLVAAGQGREDIVATLLRNQADPNVAGPDRVTPLHWAVRLRKSEMAQALIAAGANVNAEDAKGSTPLKEARAAASFADGLGAAVVKGGDRSMMAGDSADAQNAYVLALLLESGRSLRSEAAQALARAFLRDSARPVSSFPEWLSAQGVAEAQRDRVVAGLVGVLAGWGRPDDALKVAALVAERKTPGAFVARLVRSVCMATSGDRDGAAAELGAIASDKESGQIGVMARYFLAHGFGWVLESPDPLRALDDMTKRAEFVAFVRQEQTAKDGAAGVQ